MIHPSTTVATSALALLLASGACAQSTQEEFFGLDKIWDVHVSVSQEHWGQLIPQRGRTATRLFDKFPYRTADVTVGTHTFKNVGLRMKGNATFMATSGTLKRSLKIDFNRFDPKLKFLGMGKLNLQCNALDRTQIKESVSYEVYRACGIPAGRTAFARVFLTMGKDLKRTYLGLYTVVEQVDQRFLKRTLESGGLILKPQGETLAYFGPRWNDDYSNAYHPKATTTEALTRPLIETAALFDEPDDAVFAAGIEAVMDVDSFLEYTAATAILVNTDSPFTVPDNYYLVVPNSTKKVTWVPWDMNWSLGEYGHATRTPSADLSILRPTKKEVFWRMLEIPRFETRYREIAKRYIAGPCSAKAMIAHVRRAHATVKDALALEATRAKAITEAPLELAGRPMRHPMLKGREGDTVAGLEAFAKAREASVKGELAGTSKGKPAWNLFGSNERTPRGAWVRDALSETGGFDITRESFDRAAIDAAITTSFATLDTDGSESVQAQELADVLRRRWKAARRRRRADPSDDRARIAMSSLDHNGDGKITAPEWKAGVAALTRFWDRNVDELWSRQELNVPSK